MFFDIWIFFGIFFFNFKFLNFFCFFFRKNASVFNTATLLCIHCARMVRLYEATSMVWGFGNANAKSHESSLRYNSLKTRMFRGQDI
jgi:hypothetical protein